MFLPWDVQTQVASEDHMYILSVNLDNYKLKNC